MGQKLLNSEYDTKDFTRKDYFNLVKDFYGKHNPSIIWPTDNESILFHNKSWQLTKSGLGFLYSVITPFRVNFENPPLILTPRIILVCNRVINSPWYCSKKSFFLWNQRFYFELNLCNGDLNHWSCMYLNNS